MSVLGVGYPTPYLGLFREEAERCLAFMPAVQGVVKWPTNRPSLAALVDELELPLTDSAVDRVLLVHALEMARDPIALLREVWRVLAGGGRLLIVVPNRRGVWARLDTTPFGHGRPYSRSQITHLLREAWFTPTGWGDALHVPPVARGWFLRSAVAWERAGSAVATPFAVVPSRRGVWARADSTPYGQGQPYSKSQLRDLLHRAEFSPVFWGEALYAPPVARPFMMRSAPAIERVGAALGAPFAGVHIVEATKQVYRAVPVRRQRARLVPALEPALVPSPGR